jgi:hypothetical protein
MVATAQPQDRVLAMKIELDRVRHELDPNRVEKVHAIANVVARDMGVSAEQVAMIATIIYDTEAAPMTSAREMMAAAGLSPDSQRSGWPRCQYIIDALAAMSTAVKASTAYGYSAVELEQALSKIISEPVRLFAPGNAVEIIELETRHDINAIPPLNWWMPVPDALQRGGIALRFQEVGHAH